MYIFFLIIQSNTLTFMTSLTSDESLLIASGRLGFSPLSFVTSSLRVMTSSVVFIARWLRNFVLIVWIFWYESNISCLNCWRKLFFKFHFFNLNLFFHSWSYNLIKFINKLYNSFLFSDTIRKFLVWVVIESITI